MDIGGEGKGFTFVPREPRIRLSECEIRPDLVFPLLAGFFPIVWREENASRLTIGLCGALYVVVWRAVSPITQARQVFSKDS